jgi:hypothetical protein
MDEARESRQRTARLVDGMSYSRTGHPTPLPLSRIPPAPPPLVAQHSRRWVPCAVSTYEDERQVKPANHTTPSTPLALSPCTTAPMHPPPSATPSLTLMGAMRCVRV